MSRGSILTHQTVYKEQASLPPLHLLSLLQAPLFPLLLLKHTRQVLALGSCGS